MTKNNNQIILDKLISDLNSPHFTFVKAHDFNTSGRITVSVLSRMVKSGTIGDFVTKESILDELPSLLADTILERDSYREQLADILGINSNI